MKPPTTEFRLPPRWKPLRPHAEQERMAESDARFVVCAAGRRSGKTERAKRKLAREAVIFPVLRPDLEDGFFWFTAPTREQAKRLAWADLKRMVPYLFVRRYYETELIIRLYSGVELGVAGLDKPERMEGNPIDGIVIDEIANCKPEAWTSNIRPALDTDEREGWAWLIGVPEGRNHFYRLWSEAAHRKGWEQYHWRSESILTPELIAEAKRDLDERTYEQEYGASFLDFSGRVYYSFSREANCPSGELPYDKRAPLIFCFDFNVEPGSAVVCQEGRIKKKSPKDDDPGTVTLVLDEVHIPVRSNTEEVCDVLIDKYGKHEGYVYCYGDATGGAEGSAKVKGNDWDLIRMKLKPVFGNRLLFRIPKANPRERVRVNAMNSRMKPKEGPVRLLIDGRRCKELLLDFEGVTSLKGTNGKIDKKKDLERTHWSDSLGYYIVKKHPTRQRTTIDIQV